MADRQIQNLNRRFVPLLSLLPSVTVSRSRPSIGRQIPYQMELREVSEIQKGTHGGYVSGPTRFKKATPKVAKVRENQVRSGFRVSHHLRLPTLYSSILSPLLSLPLSSTFTSSHYFSTASHYLAPFSTTASFRLSDPP
ncbi:hypothetical protein Sjap_013421 [Stephania japonica]|uniref:Uncharacterized protein n=1 Tax=Stephania japonica TaxID=461633 RepID=A0AAP0NZ41_9MAGN